MDDLEALFDSVDGFKDDMIDFGLAGLGGIGANFAWGYVDDFLAKSSLPLVGGADTTAFVVRGALALAGGVVLGGMVSRYNKTVATGVAVGLAIRGLTSALKALKPDLPIGAFGLTPDEQRMLMPGTFAAAPTMVEEVAGFGAAPTTIDSPSAVPNQGAFGYPSWMGAIQ